MSLIENPTKKLVEHVLGFHNRRHDAIASNIGNANTPGYKAFDLVLKERIDGMKPLEPVMTNPRHMSLEGPSDPLGVRAVFSKDPARLDGNNVSLERELMRLLENRTLYQAGMELRDRWAALSKIARELR